MPSPALPGNRRALRHCDVARRISASRVTTGYHSIQTKTLVDPRTSLLTVKEQKRSNLRTYGSLIVLSSTTNRFIAEKPRVYWGTPHIMWGHGVTGTVSSTY
jgi:hypothetical protein